MGEDAIDKSGYNEASYKMLRLHESQRRISYVNQDLLRFYPEFSGVGYVVKKTELENLSQEVWGKLDASNKEKLEKYRTLIDDFLEVFPVHKIISITEMEGERKKKIVDQDNFKKLKQLLIMFHYYVNEMLEAAGYSTFTIDGDDGDPYN